LIQSDPNRGYQRVVDDLLPMISMLLTEKSQEVRQGAAEALVTLASHLRPGDRGDQVLMTVISLSHNNEDEDARSIAVQLLSGLAETLGTDLCRQFVGVELIALSEDPSFRVRKAAASNFAEVCRVVGDDYVLRRLWPAFNRFFNDAHWGVRKAAAENFTGIAMTLKPDARGEFLVPLMMDLLKDQSRWVRMAAHQQLGYLIAALEHHSRVPISILDQYIETIEQYRGDSEAQDICFHCAYTFAAVVKTMGRDVWMKLKAPFQMLCVDSQIRSRKSMAASMHVLANALGAALTEVDVLPQFEILLQDGQQEVRLAALQNVASMLRAAPRSTSQKQILTGLAAVLQTLMGKSGCWRVRHLVASQLGAICEALGAWPGQGTTLKDGAPSKSADDVVEGEVANPNAVEQSQGHAKDMVWQLVVPLFLQLCNDGVAEVRDETARATASTLRAAAPEMFTDPGASGTGEGSGGCADRQALPPLASRLVRRLIKTFAHGDSFRSRMSYIRMCDSVIRDLGPRPGDSLLRDLPPHVFTGLLLRPLVRLAEDPVKNVRLCWAVTMLPHVRRTGRLGNNYAVVAAACRMAANDTDKEVRNALAGTHFAELAQTVDTSIAGSIDMTESDQDESDQSEWLVSEGGTGDSSEHEGVVVGGENDMSTDGALAVAQQPNADIALGGPMLSAGENSPRQLLSTCSDDTAKAELGQSSASKLQPSEIKTSILDVHKAQEDGLDSLGDLPAKPATSPKTFAEETQAVGPVPRSPPSREATQAFTLMAPAIDPVEDTLVRQSVVERSMDALFAERRLLSEATEAGDEALTLRLPLSAGSGEDYSEAEDPETRAVQEQASPAHRESASCSQHVMEQNEAQVSHSSELQHVEMRSSSDFDQPQACSATACESQETLQVQDDAQDHQQRTLQATAKLPLNPCEEVKSKGQDGMLGDDIHIPDTPSTASYAERPPVSAEASLDGKILRDPPIETGGT